MSREDLSEDLILCCSFPYNLYNDLLLSYIHHRIL